MRTRMTLAAIGAAGFIITVTACGGAGTAVGTIDFGTGVTGEGTSQIAVTGKTSTFNAGDTLAMVGHLSRAAGMSIHVVVLTVKGSSKTVLLSTDESVPSNQTFAHAVGLPMDLQSMHPVSYEVHLDHANTILAKGTFSTR